MRGGGGYASMGMPGAGRLGIHDRTAVSVSHRRLPSILHRIMSGMIVCQNLCATVLPVSKGRKNAASR